VASITIGTTTIPSLNATLNDKRNGFSAESGKAIGEFKKAVLDAAKTGGLTAKADDKGMNKGMVLAILVYLVILVTMVYGPIAAMLVELFPTRIRYTSMSLPYHIGNGWFGGLLPTTAFAMVAATGDIYYGLWYPVIVAAGTFVIGMIFVKETKDVDIYAKD
jgi:Sugar (and other) transporter